MESLLIEKTKATPRIAFDAMTGVLLMEGSSYPENAVHFYQPVLEWLSRFLTTSSTPIVFHFRLDYFNTSSSKCIITILEMFEQALQFGRTITINWYYSEDDDDMKEHGEEFAEDFSMPFRFVVLPS